ncbi:unnamed protein product, partial [Linum tenue]
SPAIDISGDTNHQHRHAAKHHQDPNFSATGPTITDITVHFNNMINTYRYMLGALGQLWWGWRT